MPEANGEEKTVCSAQIICEIIKASKNYFGAFIREFKFAGTRNLH